VVDSLTTAPGLENSFSGCYVRGILRAAAHAWVLLAAAPSEDTATVENILAFGILWLDWTRTRAGRRASQGLRFFVPLGTSQRLRERLLALAAAVRAEIYEIREPDAAMQKIDPTAAGNLESWPVSREQIEFALHAASDTIRRVRARLPGNAATIQCRVPVVASEVALAFRGMQFARWTKQGVFFGFAKSTEPLTPTKAPSNACSINSTSIAARSPATPSTRSIAARRKDGSNPSCWKTPRNSTRCSTPAIFILKLSRSRQATELCSIC
jgi:hypothetical protein